MRLFGLIGKTLKHSFSKGYFTRKFEEEGIAGCRYENFELPSIEAFPEVVNGTPGLNGLNVTIPYKEAVLPYLHERNEVVAAIGACNCIRIQNGRLHGFNTDVFGFRTSLQQHLKPHHKKALVLGTGGAAKAVQYALGLLDISYLTVSRKEGEGLITYEALTSDLVNEHVLIINTTPLGMYPEPDAWPPIPYDALTTRHLLFDLIYNPEQTRFLQKGAEQGAAIANGHDMLVLQAEESWRIWNA